MQKRLKVERIFPLEQYGNVHITNEIVLEKDDPWEYGDIESFYDDMVREVYKAGINHHDLLTRVKEVETTEEKREVLNDGRD